MIQTNDNSQRPSNEDAVLETRIEVALHEFQTARSKPAQAVAWNKLRNLIRFRSPAQIRRMEIAQELE